MTTEPVTTRTRTGTELHASVRAAGFKTTGTRCGYRGKHLIVVADGYDKVTCDRCRASLAAAT